jgi:hypothetical protein
MPSLSLRCKRKDTTVFLIVDVSDSFAKCKARLAEALGMKGGAAGISLLVAPGEGDKEAKEYPDMAMVSDYELQDNAVIFLVQVGEPIDGKLADAWRAGTL